MLAGPADHGSAPHCEGSTELKYKPSTHGSLMLPCKIHGLDLNCLIDTGATISLLHPDKYYFIPEEMRPLADAARISRRGS